MNTDFLWPAINLVWTGILLIVSVRLFFLGRQIERRFQEIYQHEKWQQNRQRRERQL